MRVRRKRIRFDSEVDEDLEYNFEDKVFRHRNDEDNDDDEDEEEEEDEDDEEDADEKQ